ncbi:MAG: hypothetical protein BWK76_03940 [Desulfobulbaceae bacterium A2]|nr:MAG: hypothetical protein BWK76_03940 [Desulfobulbaceae bacterium A2]
MDITSDTLPAAQAAIRDILNLYVDMIRSYGGFGHGLDTGTFAPFEFVDARLPASPDASADLDLALLHAGAAIAVLCVLADCLDESGTLQGTWPFVVRARVALDAGRFAHLPEIQQALRLAFKGSEEAFRAQLARVYHIYVLAYFRQLVGAAVALPDAG